MIILILNLWLENWFHKVYYNTFLEKAPHKSMNLEFTLRRYYFAFFRKCNPTQKSLKILISHKKIFKLYINSKLFETLLKSLHHLNKFSFLVTKFENMKIFFTLSILLTWFPMKHFPWNGWRSTLHDFKTLSRAFTQGPPCVSLKGFSFKSFSFLFSWIETIEWTYYVPPLISINLVAGVFLSTF